MTETLMTILHRFFFLAADLGIMMPPGADVGGTLPAVGEGAAQAMELANGVAPAAEPAGFPMMMLAVWGLVFVGMYFFFFRPQRKREKKMKEMQASITTGDNIITTGGLFGKVADVGEDCFIIDFGTNRSIRIPVLKTDVVGVRSPKMTPQPKEE